MAKITFLLQTDSNPAPIYVRFRDGRSTDCKAKTGLVTDPGNWVGEKGRPGFPKMNNRDAALKSESNRLAAQLRKIEADLTTMYNETKDKGTIDINWLKGYLSPAEVPTSARAVPSGLIAYFEFYEHTRKHELRPASIVKLNVVKHLLERVECKLGPLQVGDIDETFKNEFVRFSVAEGYAPNTIARNFRFIKTICYDAAENGIEISARLKRLNLKNERTDKIYLTPDDLKLIEKAEFNQDHLKNAKDWLLISCETGQRVSDFMRFTPDMIRYQAGKPLIEFTQKKTGTIMTVPLSKKVMAILERRKGKFPAKMSDQRYNEHIKTVCEYAGITYEIKGSIQDPESFRKVSGVFPKYQLVTSHIGRRTFATNNYGRIPTALLISATGHTTEQMFLEYIGKSASDRALQLAEYF